MMLPEKDRIRTAFDQAASSYDQAAKVQRWVCTRLAARLPATLDPGIILDAGCGTGFGLEILKRRFPAARPIAMDFSSAMLSRISPHDLRLAGDVECIPLPAESIGLYWSSLTVQWCNLERAFQEAYRVLWPEAALALSSLTDGTFLELKNAFAQVDHYPHTLSFQNQETIESRLVDAGFKNPGLYIEPCTLYYPNLKILLRAVKSVGANQLGQNRRKGLMSRQAWQRLEAAYEAQRTPKGLPLTYQVLLVHACK